ncbi:MAG: bifunctional phosphoribosyl-AMP cyclohydrolase/phosphoribosyl-ATP diphosphatase HisIE [Bacteroidia bacterium]|nr:bifunctional phosphoribosyl-AMP cyclohydrolase/phosphoribosyl-ATP diphosphatase HisIE [Bacteroidia bacterium]
MKPNFTKSNNELIPVIIQDSNTNIVLMLGYMNDEAFEKTNTEKRVTFFSRSKNRLWTKGEESGHFLDVQEIKLDCDQDTLLIKVKPTGPTCHTGSDTCFNEKNEPTDFLKKLEQIIENRKNKPSENSYTSSLFAKGINKIAQKVGEEAVELVIEAKDSNEELFKNEAADLIFHYLVLLSAKGYGIKDIEKVLKERQANS